MANVAEKMYSVMQTRVNSEQDEREAAFAQQVAALDRSLQLRPERRPSSSSSAAATDSLTAFTVNATAFAVAAWWSLLDALLCRYRDGQQLTALSLPIQSEPVGYAAGWLAAVGYYDSGDVPELHSDLQPPKPPHPQAADATALSSGPQAGRWHAALGRSWESGAPGRRGGEGRPAEGDGRQRAEERQLPPGAWSAAAAAALLLLLLAVLLAPLCWLAGFQAGARREKRRSYEAIADMQSCSD